MTEKILGMPVMLNSAMPQDVFELRHTPEVRYQWADESQAAGMIDAGAVQLTDEQIRVLRRMEDGCRPDFTPPPGFYSTRNNVFKKYTADYFRRAK